MPFQNANTIRSSVALYSLFLLLLFRCSGTDIHTSPALKAFPSSLQIHARVICQRQYAYCRALIHCISVHEIHFCVPLHESMFTSFTLISSCAGNPSCLQYQYPRVSQALTQFELVSLFSGAFAMHDLHLLSIPWPFHH